jgi:octaprenyl-diphosphate synthase
MAAGLVINTDSEQILAQFELMRHEAFLLFSHTQTVHRTAFHPGGKWLRPRVTLLSAAHGEAMGSKVDWALVRRAALAIEIAHVGTLYHDDIVDRSPSRRGSPAIHATHGVRVAALAGADLLCLANQIVSTLPDPLPRMMGTAALRVSDGQLREIEASGSLEISPRDYLRIASKKTGSLFELAARFGATLGGTPAAQRNALASFGRHIGLAFQLFDDLDDFTTSPERHRPPANDLRERVYTLPVLIACAESGDLSKRLRLLLEDDGRVLDDCRIEEICALLRGGGAFVAAQRYAEEQMELAQQWLDRVPRSSATEHLSDLVASLSPAGPTGDLPAESRGQ